MKVSAIKCPICKDIVFSRARHDYRSCTCGYCAIDGGFSYKKVSWGSPASHGGGEPPIDLDIEVDATQQELFDDWNHRKDKYGLIQLKIYIASSWKNWEMVRAIAYFLEKRGYQVDDFTNSDKGRYVFDYREIGNKDSFNAITFLEDIRSQRAFKEDKKWLDWANTCILVLPAGRSAHLEAGYIKGKGGYLIIYHIGGFPQGEFDVMYGFADVLTPNIDYLPYALEKISKE